MGRVKKKWMLPWWSNSIFFCSWGPSTSQAFHGFSKVRNLLLPKPGCSYTAGDGLPAPSLLRSLHWQCLHQPDTDHPAAPAKEGTEPTEDAQSLLLLHHPSPYLHLWHPWMLRWVPAWCPCHCYNRFFLLWGTTDKWSWWVDSRDFWGKRAVCVHRKIWTETRKLWVLGREFLFNSYTVKVKGLDKSTPNSFLSKI